MIDLHSHILPGLDDGSPSLEVSIEMARMAVKEGTSVLACTPHITPSIYHNDTATIFKATVRLQTVLDKLNIPLRLTTGADFHISKEMLPMLRSGDAPTLGATGYFLFEPSHQVMPPKILEFCKLLMRSGYKPVLTHPERLSWIERQYATICEMGDRGVVMQVTAGSLSGGFGKRPKYWAERMLDEDRVDILASDAHNIDRRPPGLSQAAEIVARRRGEETALDLVLHNPGRILRDQTPVRTMVQSSHKVTGPKPGILSQLGLGGSVSGEIR